MTIRLEVRDSAAHGGVRSARGAGATPPGRSVAAPSGGQVPGA
jgi:hypothetical protein